MMEKQNTRVFLKVVEMGSFKQAADALGYTQAGVSYIINAMEEELEIKLFDREHGGVSLTAEGKVVLPYLVSINNGQRRLEEAVNELKDLKAGSIVIATFKSVATYWLPDIIADFKKDYPDIEINLVFCEDGLIVQDMIRRKEVDCGFFTIEPTGNIDSIMLHEEPMMAVVSLENPIASQEYFEIEDMDRLIYIGMSHDLSSEISDIFKIAGKVPKVKFTVDDDNAALAMISKDLGYGIFSQLLLENPIFPVKSLNFEPKMKRNIYAGVRSAKTTSRAVREFLRYTKEWVNEKYK